MTSALFSTRGTVLKKKKISFSNIVFPFLLFYLFWIWNTLEAKWRAWDWCHQLYGWAKFSRIVHERWVSFFEINLVFSLFLARLSLCVCLSGRGWWKRRGCRALSLVEGSRDYSLIAMPGFSLWWPLLLWSTDSRARWLSSRGLGLSCPRSMWNIPRWGKIKPCPLDWQEDS